MKQSISIGIGNLKMVAKAKNKARKTISSWKKNNKLEKNGLASIGDSCYLSFEVGLLPQLRTVFYDPEEYAQVKKCSISKIYKDIASGNFEKKNPAILIKFGSLKTAKYCIVEYLFNNKIIKPVRNNLIPAWKIF